MLNEYLLLIVALVVKSLKEVQGISFSSGGDQSQLTQNQFIDSNDYSKLTKPN